MSLSDICGEGKLWIHHKHAHCDCARMRRSFILAYVPAFDEELADMAPALALMRADPLGGQETGFTFAQHFEAMPGIWRSNAIGVHARGEWPMSEPLP